MTSQTAASSSARLTSHFASAASLTATEDSFLGGACAGAVSRTVVSPLERLKIILQVQGAGHGAYHGILPSLLRMWREEGWRGFFRGNGINCVRIAPYSAVQFTAYEQFKKLITQKGQRELTTPLRLCAGAGAGICSVVATYPVLRLDVLFIEPHPLMLDAQLDLVRSRLSIATASLGGGGRHDRVLVQHRMGMAEMTKKVYLEENGIRGLYRGLTPTVVGVAPYVGINFAAYELLRSYMVAEDGSIGIVSKLCCGGLAGSISQTLTYPLDVLRRKMQTASMKELTHTPYNSAFEAVGVILREEGIRGLYRGLLVNLLKVAPSIGTSFATYEAVKGFLE